MIWLLVVAFAAGFFVGFFLSATRAERRAWRGRRR